jgi:hypothetical protein
MINCSTQVPNEPLRILSGREVSQPLHGLEYCARNLIRRRLAHCRRRTPIVVAGQHVYWTALGIDVLDPTTPIPTSEIKVQIPMVPGIVISHGWQEYTNYGEDLHGICLTGVCMPQQVAVFQG